MRYVVVALVLLICGLAAVDAQGQVQPVDAGVAPLTPATPHLILYDDVGKPIPEAPDVGIPDAGPAVAVAPDAEVPDAGAASVAGANDAGATVAVDPDVTVEAPDAQVTTAPDVDASVITVPVTPPVVTDTNVKQTVSLLADVVQKKQWAVAMGLVMMLLVWGLRKVNVLASVPGKAMPWVATGLSLIGMLGLSLASGVPVAEALTQGLMSGLSAVGLWELAFKHIGAKTDSPA